MDAPPPPPPPSHLAALPPEILTRILVHLPLSSRANLRRSGSELRRLVDSFERDLIVAPSSSTLGNGDNDDVDVAYHAARREMISFVEDERWLPKLRSDSQVGDDVVPGPCNLRRLTSGDHLAEPINWHVWDPEGPYKRQNRTYAKGKLIDDHIWVLYSDYWYNFEVFNLDTGKAIDFHGGSCGPQKFYIEDECMSLLLETYSGRHGLLAAAMDLSSRTNPHGAWSGPYVTVWDIYTAETLMSIDLYKPMSRIINVEVVSKERVAILFAGADGVELQWHRIPQRDDEKHKEMTPPKPKPHKPGSEPPSHQCSRECPFLGECIKNKRVQVWRGRNDFWEEQRQLATEDGEGKSDEKPSYESRTKYPWWPAQTTLIQSDLICKTPLQRSNNTTMSSDGSGMLVLIVASEVQLWHVGTMALIRACEPFDNELHFHERVSTYALSMRTIIHPIADVLGPGEGSYYSQRGKEVPKLKPCRSFEGSDNPVDLPSCDAITLLSRFAHLTHDEQRNFERDQSMEEGSCSPQLDCFVRVVFAVSDERDEFRNRLVHMDISPFHHIRHRESLIVNWDEETIDENLGHYEDVLLGKISFWCDYGTHFGDSYNDEAGGQIVRVLDWRRGGIFDFYEGGPSCREREERLNNIMANTMNDDDDLDNHPQLSKLCTSFYDIQKKILQLRSISCLSIDASKLIICTGFEVAVLPFPLCLPETETLREEWQGNWINTHNLYECDKNTGTWHSFRPFDKMLINRWNYIRRLAAEEYLPSGSYDRPNDVHTITADLNECLEKEQELMKTATHGNVSPHMFFPCISWRYFAVVSSPLSSSDDDYECLHVFDVLADWKFSLREPEDVKERGDYYDARESGLHFHDENESSDEES
ncbi:hypothetical protein ACHAXR_006235 [Thalassiosira sp. AJA248-18]